MKPTILFVNHSQTHCGVYQMGRRIGSELISTTERSPERSRYRFHYMEADTAEAVASQIQQIGADAAIYNWHPSTMPWGGCLTSDSQSVKSIGLIHEISPMTPDEGRHLFGWRMVCDPSFPADGRQTFKSVRHVPRFKPPPVNNDQITVGSFGFSVGGKQYPNIVMAVAEEFPGARLRFHIPAARYGDSDGSGATAIAHQCVELGERLGLEVQVSQEFMEEHRLLHWLAENDLNVFMYDANAGRGCASTLDYAIAAQRPIAINDSTMFRHLLSALPPYPEHSLRSAFEHNGDVVRSLYASWSPERLHDDYQAMLDKVFNLEGNRVLLSPPRSGLNRILDDEAREQFQPWTEWMRRLVPDMMARKIERANVQQAFALQVVMRLAFPKEDARLLAVGAFEDTAFAALQKLHYHVQGIDTLLGHDLSSWHGALAAQPTYDVIFAVSVIEHVEDDTTFVRHMADLTKHGGHLVLTMDFNRDWRPDMPKPREDHRLYTKQSIQRLLKVIPDCELVDAPSWDTRGAHDFVYDGCQYAFATLVVRKRLGKVIE